MIFSLDVRRARKGDCLLLHFGTNAAPGLIMIDGGPSNVYQPQLRPRLEQIRKARGLANGDALPVDLLMVSHVDDDHTRSASLPTAQRMPEENSTNCLAPARWPKRRSSASGGSTTSKASWVGWTRSSAWRRGSS